MLPLPTRKGAVRDPPQWLGLLLFRTSHVQEISAGLDHMSAQADIGLEGAARSQFEDEPMLRTPTTRLMAAAMMTFVPFQLALADLAKRRTLSAPMVRELSRDRRQWLLCDIAARAAQLPCGCRPPHLRTAARLPHTSAWANAGSVADAVRNRRPDRLHRIPPLSGPA
jgi:hypothetical protein